jgi:hypothetical protein
LERELLELEQENGTPTAEPFFNFAEKEKAS